MKSKILLLAAFCAVTLSAFAAPPTTGQFLFQRKATAGFDQFGVTPSSGKVFSWDGTNITMVTNGSPVWGGITGTLSAQTDLQTALNLKLSLAGTLALDNFGSITGTMPDARLSANVQLANGTLALNGFGSVTGTLAAARIADLSATYLTVAAGAAGYQPLDADLTSWAAITRASGFDTFATTPTGAHLASLLTTGLPISTGVGGLGTGVATALGINTGTSGSFLVTSGAGTVSGSTITGGTFGAVDGSLLTALNGSQVTTGTVAAARIADLSSTYLTVAAAASGYQPLDGDLTALAALTGSNTIPYRSGTNTWAGITLGTGLTFSGGTLATSLTGTVTSVAMTVPSFLSVSGSPITTSGTLALSLANQSANTVLAGPTTGSATTPAFRALVAADIPSLSATYQPLSAGLTSIGAASTTNRLYYLSAANTWSAATVGTGLSFTTGTLTATSAALTPVTFADDAARAAATPGAVGQLGLQKDNGGLWQGQTTTVGDWNSNFTFNEVSITDFVSLNGSTSGAVTLVVPTEAGDGTITIDAGAGYFSLSGSAGGSVLFTGTLGTPVIHGAANSFTIDCGTASILVPSTINGTLGALSILTPGTGVATALAVNVGSAGAFTTFSGAHGTPSSITLTNATGLPVSTGISGLGTGVATALAVNTGTSGSFLVTTGAGTVSGSTITGGTFGAVNGSALTTLNASNISAGTIGATYLPATAQLTTGTLALGGFGSITGTLPAARVADLSATYLTNAAAVAGYQPLTTNLTNWGALTRAAGFDTFTATPTGGNLASLLTSPLSASKGGTGVANTGTITLAGNLVTTGAFNTTFVQQATSVGTLPNAATWTAARTDAAQTFTGSQTFSGGIVGTTAAGNATAGNLGEYASTLVPVGSAVSLTTATTANVASVSLTAGDWDVEGSVNYVATAATVTTKEGAISATSTTLPTDGSEVYSAVQATTTTVTDGLTLPRKRINVSGTTTVYLVAQATFSAGTVTAFGTINARRIR